MCNTHAQHSTVLDCAWYLNYMLQAFVRCGANEQLIPLPLSKNNTYSVDCQCINENVIFCRIRVNMTCVIHIYLCTTVCYVPFHYSWWPSRASSLLNFSPFKCFFNTPLVRGLRSENRKNEIIDILWNICTHVKKSHLQNKQIMSLARKPLFYANHLLCAIN